MRLVCLLLVASAAVSAQPADSVVARRPAWVSVGVSSSAPPERTRTGSDALVTFFADYHRPVGPRGLSLQIGTSSSTTFFRATSLTEAHVAVAGSVSGGPVQITVASGPSLAIVRAARYGSRGETLVGLYGRAEAVLAVVPAFGIGGHVFGHLNSGMTVIGAGMTLAFGRLPGAVFSNPPPRPRRPGP